MNGQRHGHGVLLGVDGDSYEGGWMRDREHGQGVRKNANGDTYTGSFVEGIFKHDLV